MPGKNGKSDFVAVVLLWFCSWVCWRVVQHSDLGVPEETVRIFFPKLFSYLGTDDVPVITIIIIERHGFFLPSPRAAVPRRFRKELYNGESSTGVVPATIDLIYSDMK